MASVFSEYLRIQNAENLKYLIGALKTAINDWAKMSPNVSINKFLYKIDIF